ncbi:MAG: UDP-N-acetylglucosamine 2-epimerase (non-hydrolyzing) [Thermoproteota archaeon]|nr:UDP-N-acetylglucosamine 2-epimerase (non-hydrolyzing) [Candidatus Brockarchaeota archaeon]
MSILVVVGTRPEIIKMAPVIRRLEEKGLEYVFVHTGQHHDYEMSRIFIEELELPSPHVSFKLSNSSPASQIGEMIIKLENSLAGLKPSILLVEGDTNTILSATIAGIKMGVKIGHVEAGLRSYDWRMPEEHNRRMVDHVSDHLFAPTDVAKRNLVEEKVWGSIHVTGNTVIDALNLYLGRVRELEDKVMGQVKFTDYILATFHRAENVDDPNTLRNFLEILRRSPLPVVLPLHPRTRRRLQEQGLMSQLESLEKIRLMPPCGYFEFLALMKNARLLMTDSGGIQEEATHPAIRKHVLVLRSSTERPEAVSAGFARVVGVDPTVVLPELENLLSNRVNLPHSSPFGDGKASERIVDIVSSDLYT